MTGSNGKRYVPPSRKVIIKQNHTNYTSYGDIPSKCCPQRLAPAEANGDSRSTNLYVKGTSLDGSLGSSYGIKEIFGLPWLLYVSRIKKISSPYTILLYYSIAQQAGHWQAVVPRRLSLNMCLWCCLYALCFMLSHLSALSIKLACSSWPIVLLSLPCCHVLWMSSAYLLLSGVYIIRLHAFLYHNMGASAVPLTVSLFPPSSPAKLTLFFLLTQTLM